MNLNKNMMIGLGVVGLLIVLGGGIFAFKQFNKPQDTNQEEQSKKKKISEPVNVIEVGERPYMYISPLADGRNLEVVVAALNKPADSMEYELEYQAGSLLQGAFGLVELTSLPAKAKVLLGSCSAGGACTYHEDVKGGTLLARFEGSENYAVKQDWRYFDNAAGDSQVASKDAKFQLDSEDLASQRFIIVYNSPGYPEGLKGNVVSEAYSLTSSSALKGEGELSIRSNEEGTLTIMGYNGSEWHSFDTTTDGKTATATVDLMELYIVVAE